MPGSPFFVQRCPSCGRQARIDVNYLNLNVVCQHCDHTFIAQEAASAPTGINDSAKHWIRIADHVLDEDILNQSVFAFRPR